MNYRHAFHAGNVADVFKHALLARVLAYLVQKPAPLRYIDTHAGTGRYDLGGEAAARTGEWRSGIGAPALARAPAEVAALLEPYLTAVGSRDEARRPFSYPGSPAIAQWILRPQDRLTLCELHAADARALKANMGRDRRLKSIEIDGYLALKAFVPPVERRGLVLIDPPFEDRSEFDRLLAGLTAAWRKWPGGTYMAWYPVKDLVGVNRWTAAAGRSGIRRLHRFHLFVGRPGGPDAPLAGSGLLIVNPPFTLKAEAEVLLPFLAQALAPAGDGAWSAEVLAGD